jgi:hypothetical protein
MKRRGRVMLTLGVPVGPNPSVWLAAVGDIVSFPL